MPVVLSTARLRGAYGRPVPGAETPGWHPPSFCCYLTQHASAPPLPSGDCPQCNGLLHRSRATVVLCPLHPVRSLHGLSCGCHCSSFITARLPSGFPMPFFLWSAEASSARLALSRLGADSFGHASLQLQCDGLIILGRAVPRGHCLPRQVVTCWASCGELILDRYKAISVPTLDPARRPSPMVYGLTPYAAGDGL